MILAHCYNKQPINFSKRRDFFVVLVRTTKDNSLSNYLDPRTLATNVRIGETPDLQQVLYGLAKSYMRSAVQGQSVSKKAQWFKTWYILYTTFDPAYCNSYTRDVWSTYFNNILIQTFKKFKVFYDSNTYLMESKSTLFFSNTFD